MDKTYSPPKKTKFRRFWVKELPPFFTKWRELLNLFLPKIAINTSIVARVPSRRFAYHYYYRAPALTTVHAVPL